MNNSSELIAKLLSLRGEFAEIDRQMEVARAQNELDSFRELFAANQALARTIEFLNSMGVDSRVLASLLIELGSLGDGRPPGPMLRSRAQSGAIVGHGKEFLWGSLAAVLHLRQQEEPGREKASKWLHDKIPNFLMVYLGNPSAKTISKWKDNYTSKSCRVGIGLSAYQFAVRTGEEAQKNGGLNVAETQLGFVLEQAKSIATSLPE